jgi:hypothetical protein
MEALGVYERKAKSLARLRKRRLYDLAEVAPTVVFTDGLGPLTSREEAKDRQAEVLPQRTPRRHQADPHDLAESDRQQMGFDAAVCAAGCKRFLRPTSAWEKRYLTDDWQMAWEVRPGVRMRQGFQQLPTPAN